jgi:hypothetical protein
MSTTSSSPCSKALTWWKAKKGSLSMRPTRSPVCRLSSQNGVPRSGCQRKFSINGRNHSSRLNRIHHQREFRQDGVILAQAKAVHVGRSRGGHLADQVGLGAARQPVQPVMADGVVAGDDVVHGARVVVGMHGGHLPHLVLFVLQHARHLQRFWIKLHLDGRFGQGDKAVSDFGQAHLGAVGDLRREDGHHPAKERAAGVGGKFGVGDTAAFLRLRVGPVVQKFVGVAHLPAAKGKFVQHRQPVEPVAVALLAHAESAGAVAQQRAAEPFRQAAA